MQNNSNTIKNWLKCVKQLVLESDEFWERMS